MPTTSEWHEAVQALLDAYMTTLVTDSITSLDADSSSDSDSSDSKSSSSSSSCSQSHDTILYPSTSDVLLTALNGLYAQRYLTECISINKSSALTTCLSIPTSATIHFDSGLFVMNISVTICAQHSMMVLPLLAITAEPLSNPNATLHFSLPSINLSSSSVSSGCLDHLYVAWEWEMTRCCTQR